MQTPPDSQRTKQRAGTGGGRIRGLDALRGLAAVAVTFYHFTSTGYDRLYPRDDGIFLYLAVAQQGVSLFFMISGFVILMTLDRTKTISDFAVSRVTRLYPTFWVSVLLTFAVVQFCGLPGREASAVDLLVNLTMLQHLLGFASVDGVYWTLHCELCFYVLMALIVAVGLRRHLPTVLVAIVLCDLIYRSQEISICLPGSWRIRSLPDNMHWFAIGVLFYEMRGGWKLRHLLMLAICLLAGCYVTYFGCPYHHGRPDPNWAQVACAMGCVALMFVATRHNMGLLTSSVFVFMGTISYPLYLLHNNIGMVIIRAGYRQGLSERSSIAIALAATLILASIVTFTVERPATAFLREKYKLWKKRREAKAAPTDHPTP